MSRISHAAAYCFNPVHPEFHAASQFGKLPFQRKMAVLFATTVLSLATCFIGTIASFRYFTARLDPSAEKTNNVAQGVIKGDSSFRELAFHRKMAVLFATAILSLATCFVGAPASFRYFTNRLDPSAEKTNSVAQSVINNTSSTTSDGGVPPPPPPPPTSPQGGGPPPPPPPPPPTSPHGGPPPPSQQPVDQQRPPANAGLLLQIQKGKKLKKVTESQENTPTKENEPKKEGSHGGMMQAIIQKGKKLKKVTESQENTPTKGNEPKKEDSHGGVMQAIMQKAAKYQKQGGIKGVIQQSKIPDKLKLLSLEQIVNKLKETESGIVVPENLKQGFEDSVCLAVCDDLIKEASSDDWDEIDIAESALKFVRSLNPSKKEDVNRAGAFLTILTSEAANLTTSFTAATQPKQQEQDNISATFSSHLKRRRSCITESPVKTSPPESAVNHIGGSTTSSRSRVLPSQAPVRNPSQAKPPPPNTAPKQDGAGKTPSPVQKKAETQAPPPSPFNVKLKPANSRVTSKPSQNNPQPSKTPPKQGGVGKTPSSVQKREETQAPPPSPFNVKLRSADSRVTPKPPQNNPPPSKTSPKQGGAGTTPSSVQKTEEEQTTLSQTHFGVSLKSVNPGSSQGNPSPSEIPKTPQKSKESKKAQGEIKTSPFSFAALRDFFSPSKKV